MRQADVLQDAERSGFQLKGSGWYATDFKHSGAKPAAKPDVKSATASGGKDKGDAKSDAKARCEVRHETRRETDKKAESKSESNPNLSAAGQTFVRSVERRRGEGGAR